MRLEAKIEELPRTMISHGDLPAVEKLPEPALLLSELDGVLATTPWAERRSAAERSALPEERRCGENLPEDRRLQNRFASE